MSGFALHLQSVSQYELIEDVVSFVAEDESGSFGLMAGHADLMTALSFGLARYRQGTETWEYLAIPGGLLHFKDNTCYVTSRTYVRSSDYANISRILTEQLMVEEQKLQELK
ncbi:MAG: F0F1 ATP synthase subunit epsilon, partial [Gammaproteobacteria bacterium]|nr:F0F1 ATP synthase subunit epsilon [Gammaproteobacteria bacterium]